jgi:acetaldehyde dehydrogenase
MKVAILGTGMIGTDLLVKVHRSPLLECAEFVGRRADSPGIAKAKELGVKCYTQGIDEFARLPWGDTFGEHFSKGLMMIATDARDSRRVETWVGARVEAIDLTPANHPVLCVPAWNIASAAKERLVSMVSCGAQASIPLLTAAWSAMDEPIEYVEVVSSIASKSAGPATRANIEEYIQRTEAAIKMFTGAPKAKAVLILNPADPPVGMQTTLRIVPSPNDDSYEAAYLAIHKAAERARQYVPGYEIVFIDWSAACLTVSVRVKGRGDWLPPYAGNLDIITSAAVALAEAKARLHGPNP